MNHGRPDYNRRIVDLDGLIPEDEPVFFVRGRDKAAVAAARFYATEVKRLGGPDHVVQRAADQADAIEAWQREHGTRMPD